ncbi:hypothetical protein Ahy_A03g014957 [Arachis hypogaea]|uniref:FAR1 domain-containing protein n=1 Tax=Arachis hypogaea TaxID=3818 RepID=A0A445DZ88_ARAHY|nr:hypothetical protein Ahy_A03g014957 [Arachis hypogaea]
MHTRKKTDLNTDKEKRDYTYHAGEKISSRRETSEAENPRNVAATNSDIFYVSTFCSISEFSAFLFLLYALFVLCVLFVQFLCDVDEQFVPKIGMTFNMLEEAEQFYKDYSKLADFSTKIQRTNKKGNKIKNQLITYIRKGK